jgi:hypothetical protein
MRETISVECNLTISKLILVYKKNRAVKNKSYFYNCDGKEKNLTSKIKAEIVLSLLPQGKVEAARRVKAMVAKMDELGFGNCTNTGACETECQKIFQSPTLPASTGNFFQLNSKIEVFDIAKLESLKQLKCNICYR